jgi:hypothetical protein
MAELPFGDKPNQVSQELWLELLTAHNVRPDLPDDMPLSLRNIIQRGWSSDPSERPPAEQILSVLDDFVNKEDRLTKGSVEDMMV